jgi:hypothetical protein
LYGEFARGDGRASQVSLAIKFPIYRGNRSGKRCGFSGKLELVRGIKSGSKGQFVCELVRVKGDGDALLQYESNEKPIGSMAGKLRL